MKELIGSKSATLLARNVEDVKIEDTYPLQHYKSRSKYFSAICDALQDPPINH